MSKNIIITGASSGLGLSHAIYLTSLGHTVVGTSRKAEQLDPVELKKIFLRDHKKYKFSNKEQTEIVSGNYLIPESVVSNLDEYLKKIRFVNMDITDDDSVNTALQSICLQMTPEVLINNAGYTFWGPSEEISMKDLVNLFEVNLFGQYRVIKAILPYMRMRKYGLIINTTSMASIVGIPFAGHYSASKSGIERLTETLFTELINFNIKVCSVLPGDINTAINANLIGRFKNSERYISSDINGMINSHPIPEKSPYYENSKKMWDTFIRNHILAPPPFHVSKLVAKIIQVKNPKIHYKSGNVGQTVILPLLKSILPEKIFFKVLAKMFGI